MYGSVAGSGMLLCSGPLSRVPAGSTTQSSGGAVHRAQAVEAGEVVVGLVVELDEDGQELGRAGLLRLLEDPFSRVAPGPDGLVLTGGEHAARRRVAAAELAVVLLRGGVSERACAPVRDGSLTSFSTCGGA
ncbi:hypothetical protein GCM10020001_013300 [Nonomuraea salmonea]